MAFDVQAARGAGYSDGEIASFLAEQSKFDLPAAQKAGYEPAEIIDFLSAAKPTQAKAASPKSADIQAPQDLTRPAGALRQDIAPTTAAAAESPAAEGPSFLSRVADSASTLVKGVAASNPILGRALNIAQGPQEKKINSVLEGKQMPGVPFDAAEAERMSRRDYVEQKDNAARTANSPVIQEQRAPILSDRQKFAEKNPIAAGFAQSAASTLAGTLNAPAAAAGLAGDTVNRMAQSMGVEQPAGRVGNMPLVDDLKSIGSQYASQLSLKSPGKAWDDGDFGRWMLTQMSGNSFSAAQSLGALFVPGAQASLLASMGGISAGNAYAEGDTGSAAALKGLVEAGSEMLPLKAAEKIKDVVLAIPSPARNRVLAEAGKRLLAAGTAVTTNSMVGAIEEVAAEIGGNAVDKFVSDKDKSLFENVDRAAVVGAAFGTGFSAPAVMDIAAGPQATRARELAASLRQGGATPDQVERTVADVLRTEQANGIQISPAATSVSAAQAAQERQQQAIAQIGAATNVDQAIAAAAQGVTMPTAPAVEAAPAAPTQTASPSTEDLIARIRELEGQTAQTADAAIAEAQGALNGNERLASSAPVEAAGTGQPTGVQDSAVVPEQAVAQPAAQRMGSLPQDLRTAAQPANTQPALTSAEPAALIALANNPTSPLAQQAAQELRRRETEYVYQQRAEQEQVQRQAEERALLDETADQQIAQSQAVQSAQTVETPTAMQAAFANARPLRDRSRATDTEAPRAQITQAQPATPAFQFKKEPAGTLRITGNAKEIRERLADYGVDKIIPARGGVVVAKSQAAIAQRALGNDDVKFSSGQDKRIVADRQGAEYSLTVIPQTFGVGATEPNSVMVEVRDPVTNDRRGFVDFAILSDGTLQAENAKVAPQYQRRGLAETMYKAARDAGYDITPGRFQTDQGNAMVRRLQEQGVINRGEQIAARASEGGTTRQPDAGIARANEKPAEASADHQRKADVLLKRLRRDYPDVSFRAIEPEAGLAGEQLAAARIAGRRLFRRDVVFLEFDGPALFNGVVLDAERGTIFLNAKADKPHLAVLGHELLHEMKASNPDLYKRFSDSIDSLIKDESKYRAKRPEVYKNLSEAAMREELHADIVGDHFTDPQFWEDLAAEQPTLFQRVAQSIRQFLSRVLVKARPFGTERFLNDVQAARDAVTQAMREFSQDQVRSEGRQTDGVAMSASDASPSATDDSLQPTVGNVFVHRSNPYRDLIGNNTRRQALSPQARNFLASFGNLLVREGVQPAANQDLGDRLRRDADILGNLRDSSAFRDGGYNALDIPSKRMVNGAVVTWIQDRKILNSVVELIPVDVMNMLIAQQSSAKDGFNDKPVLSSLPTIGVDRTISIIVDNPAFESITSHALEVAKESSGLGVPDVARLLREGGATKGTFNDDSGHTNSVSFSLSNPSESQEWAMPDSSRIDRIIYETQDQKIDLKRTQEAIKQSGREIDERFDARTAETLYAGRVAYRSEQFLNAEAKPLLQAMTLAKVGMDDLADYLHARGAEERNAQIAKVNPDMPDGGAGTNSKGTLLTTDVAREYLAAIPADRRKVLDSLAKRVDAITKGTRELLVNEGIEKREVVDAWEAAYKNYVPMFRDEAESGELRGGGGGFNVRGANSQRATGSTKQVTNILAHVLMQREAAITRAEKNRVGMSLYGLALTNPNKDVWTTIRPEMKAAEIAADLKAMGVDPLVAETGMSGIPTIRTVDPITNTVVDRVNPMYKNLPGAIVLKVGGEDRVLLLNEKDPRALRMAQALKNLDGLTNFDLAGSIIGRTTRWLAAVNTQYNPAFGLVNGIRDTFGGAINLSSTEIKGQSAKVLFDAYTKAGPGIVAAMRGKTDNPWAKLYEQFQEDGGKTGYRDMFRTAEDRTKAIEAELKGLESEGKLTPRKAAQATFQLLDNFNTAIENAVRLSAYSAALDSGLSRPKAAKLARELTVDFNRKGRLGREVGPLYAFFNASVQGTARTIEALKGPTGAKIIAGGLALGAAQAIMLALAGFDEDEVPEFIKARALIIPILGGKEKRFVAIPLPLGLHILPNTGRVITDLALAGGKDAGKKTFSAVGEVAGAFNPLGGGNIFTADGALRTALPTIIDPIVEIGFNKNFAGNAIEKEARGESDVRPGFARVKESTQRSVTGQAYIGISKALNKLSGGSDYEAGLASPSPEMVQYVAHVAGGGLLREIEKSINISGAQARGDKVPASKIPVLGRLYGEVDADAVAKSRYYESTKNIMKAQAAMKAATKSGDADAVQKMYEERPELLVASGHSKISNSITALNKLATSTVTDPEQLREIDQARLSYMRALNESIKAAEEIGGKSDTPRKKLQRLVKREEVAQ